MMHQNQCVIYAKRLEDDQTPFSAYRRQRQATNQEANFRWHDGIQIARETAYKQTNTRTTRGRPTWYRLVLYVGIMAAAYLQDLRSGHRIKPGRWTAVDQAYTCIQSVRQQSTGAPPSSVRRGAGIEFQFKRLRSIMSPRTLPSDRWHCCNGSQTRGRRYRDIFIYKHARHWKRSIITRAYLLSAPALTRLQLFVVCS